MIIALAVGVWFICGMLGVFIGNSMDRADGITQSPESVFLACLGVLIFVVVLVIVVEECVEAKARLAPPGHRR